MSAASSARVLQVEGAIHTSEVAVNGRLASPWAAAGTAAARVRSSKVYGLRSKGILLAKEGNGDLCEVSGEHHKAWRMCYMRCEHLFTPLTDPIIPVAPDPPPVETQGGFASVDSTLGTRRVCSSFEHSTTVHNGKRPD